MVAFRGSTQEKSPSGIFRFGYGKSLNDKKVPDPVGSEVLLRKRFSSEAAPRDRFIAAANSIASEVAIC
jgi:hypothetical protein